MIETALPIEEIRENLLQALRVPTPRILLRAETGSGKSTCVPLMLAESPEVGQGTILVVQPRRLAARLLARFVASKSNSELGRYIGYTVRFDRKVSSETRVIFMTDGVLERYLTDNPNLDGVSAVIFDEFHERSLSSDLSLGRVSELQQSVRPDLALVVMSATLETDGLKTYLGDSCRVLEASGRRYPVDVLYRSAKGHSTRGLRQDIPSLWDQTVQTVREAVRDADCGNILIFMPGVYEIRRTVELLESCSWLRDWDIFPLYGALSPEKQNQAVECGSRPRIIVSTNVAETSLTIEGIRTVIDSGLARQSAWDPYRGMNTLKPVLISKASAAQRAGRAGRTAPGKCYRLWSKADQERRPEQELPECRRVDLSEAVLHLAVWGNTNPDDFLWPEKPEATSLQKAVDLLKTLGALDETGALSEEGRRMADYPLPPRLSRLMVAGVEEQCIPEMAAIAALIQGEGVPAREGLSDDFTYSSDYTDFQAEWRALEQAEEYQFDLAYCRRVGISARGAREVSLAYRQLLNVGSRGRFSTVPTPDFEAHRVAVVRALAESFADYIGVRTGVASHTCKLANGVSGRVVEGSVAFQSLHFIAAEMAELTGKITETRVRRCTVVSPEELKSIWPRKFSESDEAVFDATLRRVRKRHRICLGKLVLEDRDAGDAVPEEAASLLAEKVTDGTLKLTRWDHAVEQWIRRLNGLSRWMPELELPAFTAEDQLTAIALVCEGAIGYKDIKDREIFPVLREWLSKWQAKALDDYAPVSLKLSNGQTAKVRYEEDSTPVIGLTVQRLFGVTESPTIAGGKMIVKTEILAPNQRPWQLTTDLSGFWKHGYVQMKKDLAGRYPKHAWPDGADISRVPQLKRQNNGLGK